MQHERRRVLFLQATEPGAYPPLINAASLMADDGWDVTFLSAPVKSLDLSVPPHPRITVRTIRTRPSHVMKPAAYAGYVTAAVAHAVRLLPKVVYASDPLGALPGLLAARTTGATLLYHEHDTPAAATLQPVIRIARQLAARAAHFVIFPNAERAYLAQTQLRFAPERLRVVWNLPRLRELPPLVDNCEPGLVLYYHGSITPDRIPDSLVRTLPRFMGAVRLRIAGYEAPSACGYLRHMLEIGRGPGGAALVHFEGLLQRDEALRQACSAHVGLALMPKTSSDINMCHMVGASNKAFDYMAARLAVLVADLPEWRRVFVESGYARPCDTESTDSIEFALRWFLENAEQRKSMATSARRRIEEDWNYDSMFAPVLQELSLV